ncbi:MAG: hypothetical protein AAB385_05615 [Planctomycetota bacterium]
MRGFVIAFFALTVIGCTRVEYLDYRGVQSWPTGSAFVQDVDNVDVYEGLPDREYEVIGLIDVYDDKPFFHDDGTRKKVIKMAKEHKADAIVWLSDRTVSSGSLKMGQESKGAASLDTGRSSQPEMLVTNVSQYAQGAAVATSYKKSLRSSLLLVKWK